MSADPRGPEIPQTILVTGGRAWSNFDRLTTTLDEAARQARGPVRLLVGDCPTGADQQARIWARRRGVPAEVFRARWDEMEVEGKPRKAAGPLRNLELLDALDQAIGDRLVFAFHEDLERSRGTRQCVAAARRRGYDVTIVGREPLVEILEREGIAEPGSLRAAALEYARRGIPVVPLHYPVERLRPHEPPVAGCSCHAPDCQRIGKHPMAALVPHGVKDASSDPAVLADWWARYPQANVGLATGFKFDVLDVDGPEGAAWLRRFAGERGLRVGGPLVHTGSGGWHYYLAPTGLRCPSLWDRDTGKELGHLDWRGRGGLVVAPPSIHATGRPYRFLRDLDTALPEVPPALRALLDPPATRAERPSVGTRPAGLGHPYGVAALDGECQRVATTPPGSHQRNKTLYKASLRCTPTSPAASWTRPRSSDGCWRPPALAASPNGAPSRASRTPPGSPSTTRRASPTGPLRPDASAGQTGTITSRGHAGDPRSVNATADRHRPSPWLHSGWLVSARDDCEGSHGPGAGRLWADVLAR